MVSQNTFRTFVIILSFNLSVAFFTVSCMPLPDTNDPTSMTDPSSDQTDADETNNDPAEDDLWEHPSVFADTVVWAPGSNSVTGYGDPSKAVNGVRGGGNSQGSFDVYSLGTNSVNKMIVLSWSGRIVSNGPGDDFTVFENAFYVGGQTNTVNMEPLVVAVSLDGTNWAEFPHDYTASDETVFSGNPDDWEGFAGITPVLFHEKNSRTDPFDQALSGGDPFDLDNLETDAENDLKKSGVRYVKLTAASSMTNSDTGFLYPVSGDSFDRSPDIDGVYGRYLCEDISGN